MRFGAVVAFSNDDGAGALLAHAGLSPGFVPVGSQEVALVLVKFRPVSGALGLEGGPFLRVELLQKVLDGTDLTFHEFYIAFS